MLKTPHLIQTWLECVAYSHFFSLPKVKTSIYYQRQANVHNKNGLRFYKCFCFNINKENGWRVRERCRLHIGLVWYPFYMWLIRLRLQRLLPTGRHFIRQGTLIMQISAPVRIIILYNVLYTNYKIKHVLVNFVHR